MQELWVMLTRTLILYGFILVTLRVMGKREIGKLSVFDLVVSIIIAEIAAFTIDDTKMPLYKGLLPIALLAAVQIAFSYLSLKSRRFRELIDGKPSLIIEKGKIRDAEMRRHRYNIDDLLMQLREKDIADLGEVEFAFLEPTGKLSVIKKRSKQPVTNEDLGRNVPSDGLMLPLIIDGEILQDNLRRLGKDEWWLKMQLRYHGSADVKDVLFAGADETGRFFVDYRDEVDPPDSENGAAKPEARR
ncbi:DUF421 domain-containing protein [Hydrogenibacillus sp. N12]|uniref:DUF421 domain-containing protein n=1 Tax=Hydrogenibacillus sp. N12 TaxID=2866627 RepID=UPI001C7D0289|nr:DUF421 domain-containing protein [Hydrogenibacillus sp. N12]QZA33884.1 DUF421 domain-containing protein [Hydrogenibacillus sp. N12]